MQLSLQDCENERKLARMGYTHIKQKDLLKLDENMESLATFQALGCNKSKSNAIKRMKRLEEIRLLNRRIKHATKSFHDATERVQIPDVSNDG